MNYKNMICRGILVVFIIHCITMAMLTFCAIPKKKSDISLTGQLANDLIIILDAHEQETEKQPGAMTQTFLMALQQEAAPIIVTKKIVENVCFLIQIMGKNNIQQMRDTIRQTNNLGIIQKKYNALYATLLPNIPTTQKEKIIRPLVLPIISMIDLNNKNWHGYLHQTENLLLFIPQKYLNTYKQGDIKKSGFALDSLIKIPDLTPDVCLQFLKKREANIEVSDLFIEAIESIFIYNKLQPTLRITTEQQAKISQKKQIESEDIRQASLPFFWNIFVAGHGSSAQIINKESVIVRNISVLKGNIEIRAKNIVVLKKNITILTSGREKNKTRLDNERKTMEEMQQKMEEEQKQVDEMERHVAQGVVPGMLAGLSFVHFSRLAKFFEQKITTKFLYYSTCFGGGVNQAFLNDELKKLQVNFITVSEGIAETTVQLITSDPYISKNTNDWIFSTRQFGLFFKHLHAFFGDTDMLIEPERAVVNVKKENSAAREPLKNIIDSLSIVIGKNKIENAVFIRFPSVGTFSAMNIDQKIKILTNSMVRAYELEGEAIDVTDAGIENIIIYPQRIGVTLDMRQEMGKAQQPKKMYKALILPTPAEFSPSYKSICIFEKIIFDNSLSSFIFNCSVRNASRFKKLFLIKSLDCLDYGASGLGVGDNKKMTIENMIILFSPTAQTGNSNEVGANLDVCFKLKSATYYGTIAIAGFENTDLLSRLCNSCKFSIADCEKIKELAGKILDQTNLLCPKESAAALEILTTEIDNLVEKIVVSPGALKEVLLKKMKTGPRTFTPEILSRTNTIVTPEQVLKEAGILKVKELQDMLGKVVIK